VSSFGAALDPELDGGIASLPLAIARVARYGIFLYRLCKYRRAYSVIGLFANIGSWPVVGLAKSGKKSWKNT